MPEPLFRYSDQPRKVGDATLWGLARRAGPKCWKRSNRIVFPALRLNGCDA